MKNYLIFSVLLLFFFQKINAQITLSQGDYPLSVLGIDTLKKTLTGISFPSLIPATNATWDMSALMDTTPIYYDYRVGSVTHQFADSNTYKILNYNYKGNAQLDITTAGIFEYGIKIPVNIFCITSWTAGPFDSIIILSQNMMYSSPLTIISFPGTYGSNWGSNYYSDLNYQLSVSAWGYNHAPGYRRRHTVEKDTVTGWGKMRVKNISGFPSSWFDALQVQTTTTTIDSFFLNGAPFNSAYLSAFLLTQGAKTTTYKQNYYRLGEVTPLESVLFTDSTYAHPYSAMTHTQRLVNVGVEEIVENPVVVYPNPVSGNSIYIQLPINGKEWTFELFDLTGKVVLSGKLNTRQGTAQIELPKDITKGNYLLKISAGKELECIREITIGW